MTNALTLDQIRVFIAVSDAGSFSKAAKVLNRAQSAVTYAIQKLETETGIAVFDRSAYRPVLTEAGKALLVRARRISEESNGFRDQARSLARKRVALISSCIAKHFQAISMACRRCRRDVDDKTSQLGGKIAGIDTICTNLGPKRVFNVA